MKIKTKIFWAFFIVALFPLVVTSYSVHQNALNMIKSQELTAFKMTNYQAANEFSLFISKYEEIVRFLSEAPPIQGMIRARANRGIDPFDQSGINEWKGRLKLIFISYLKANDAIYELSYLNAFGQEVVRAQRDRDSGIVDVLSYGELESRADMPYFIKAAHMLKGEIYHSSIDLYREYGRLKEPYFPVTRISIPVFGEKSQRFEGVVVVKVLMEAIFDLIKEASLENAYIIIDEQGQYLFSQDESKMFSHLISGEAKNYFSSDALKLFVYDEERFRFYDEDRKRHIVKEMLFYDGEKDRSRYWVILQELSSVDLFKKINAITDVVLFNLLIAIVFVIIVVLFLSQSISKPIQQLTEMAQRILYGTLDVNFDENIKKSNDEVGVLASTMESMTKKLINLNDNLAVEVGEKTRDLHLKNQALEKETKRAVQAAKAKSNFLANMSHEIRTPMNSILGFSDLLTHTKLTEKQKSYLRSIHSSGELLVGIIDDILDISKLEAGKINLERVDVDLERLIYDVFHMITTRLKNNYFDTYIDIDPDVPRVVKGDPTRLKQIFVNLLGNAVKFTHEGEIGVIVRCLEPVSDSGGALLEFTVKDTGVGIPADKVNHVFELFAQADESTTRKYGGTGLGLAITKALVEVAGGHIRVESEEGQGSRFIFTMPLIKSEADPDSDMSNVDIVKHKTVFILDDNQVALKIIEKCCRELDLKVVGMSQSPQEALHKLEKMVETKGFVPDIILSDLMMDGMSGFDVADAVRKKEAFKDTAFIAVTADIKAENEKDPEHKFFNAYVTKPISAEALMHAFSSVLGPNIEEGAEMAGDLVNSCDGVKVFVVEDVPMNQMLMGEYFKQLGCEGVFADNGQDAIDKLKENCDYDLCFMDLQMPVMGGIDATKIIRDEITQDLPIIALTAAVMEDDRKQAIEVGMTDFLAKPISVDLLKDKILQYAKK